MSDKNEKVSIEKSSTVTKRKIEDTSNSSETLKVAKKSKISSNDQPKTIDNSKKSVTKDIGEECFKSHTLLHLSYKLVYEPCGIVCKFRVAKKTPTKVGQFVTLWKRIGKGPIQPYDIKDPIDIYIICVQEGKNVGQFVFPKNVLASEDVLSKSGKGGKRAIRVYAPWVKTESSQASSSKLWQTKYFINMSDSKKIDLDRVKKLYGVK